jgi:hypothetical protein
LIFDAESYRFQKYISDIGGQDIHHHGNDPEAAVARVRDWLRTESSRDAIPGGAAIFARYQRYRQDLPTICDGLRLDLAALTFVDFSFTVATWLAQPRS